MSQSESLRLWKAEQQIEVLQAKVAALVATVARLEAGQTEKARKSA